MHASTKFGGCKKIMGALFGGCKKIMGGFFVTEVEFLGCSEAKHAHSYGCDREKQVSNSLLVKLPIIQYCTAENIELSCY